MTQTLRQWLAAASLTLGLATMAVDVSASVVLHEHDNFNGRSTTVLLRTPNLGQWSFNDTASSLTIHSGWWQFCEHADFSGECMTLGPGRYASLREQNFNDRITSVRPIQPPVSASQNAIELFEHNSQIGRSFKASGATSNLQRDNFNDVASSVVVRAGRWELCADAEFMGRCVVVGPGIYPDLGQWGMNDQISSVRPSTAPLSPGIMSIGMPGGPTSGSGSWIGGGNRPFDESTAPEITFSANRTSRVSFPGNPCVVIYGRNGQRIQNLPQCDAAQIAQADDLMGRFRSELGLDRRDAGNPWSGLRAPGGPGTAGGLPAAGESIQVLIELNREGEVRFGNGCVVNYSGTGRRTGQAPSCSGDQIRRADDEMANYRRASGL
ncbi:MAG: beta/gamma crystallin family protein [Rubrivivax sp.]|jgi:hypothetical protein|nr:beta/gamma crystallin family protein [Rubrivivax sp.]